MHLLIKEVIILPINSMYHFSCNWQRERLLLDMNNVAETKREVRCVSMEIAIIPMHHDPRLTTECWSYLFYDLLFLVMCMCGCLYISHACSCQRRPEEGSGFLGTEVTGCCELPDVVLGTELLSCPRTVCAADCRARPAGLSPGVILYLTL